MTPATPFAPTDPLDADLANRLLVLEKGCLQKLRLARVLTSASGTRALSALAGDATCERCRTSPLGRPDLEQLWRQVETVTTDLLQLDPGRLRSAFERWAGSDKSRRVLNDLFLGATGVRELVLKEAAFLGIWSACSQQPNRGLQRVLAQEVSAFAASLVTEIATFRRFMHELRARGRAPLGVRVYGFGEISRPVGLARGWLPVAAAIEPANVVYKRLAPFPSAESVGQYLRAYNEYNRRLRDDVGIAVPPWGARVLRQVREGIIVVTTQAALPPDSIGKAILLRRDAAQCDVLFGMVLAEYRKLARYNRSQAPAGISLGIDGQITNWAIRDYDDAAPLCGDEGLFYIDTNTPMIRTHGRDCLPLDFYLQGFPRLVRRFVRPMAKRVLDRYFDPRTIVLDFLANTSIHGRGDLVDRFLLAANAFLTEGLITPTPQPITKTEVQRYTANDVATWRLSRSMRVVEEMLRGRRGVIKTARVIQRIYTEPIF